MLNHLIAWKAGEARRLELLQEAEKARLLKKIRAQRARFRDPHLLWLGNLLIAAGERLREGHGSDQKSVAGDNVARPG